MPTNRETPRSWAVLQFLAAELIWRLVGSRVVVAGGRYERSATFSLPLTLPLLTLARRIRPSTRASRV